MRHCSSDVRFLILITLLSWLPFFGTVQLLSYLAACLIVVCLIMLNRLALPRGVGVLWIAIIAFAGLSWSVETFTQSKAYIFNIALGIMPWLWWLACYMRVQPDRKGYMSFISAVSVLSIIEGIWATLQFLNYNVGFHFAIMSAGDVAVGSLLSNTNSHLFSLKMGICIIVLFTAVHFVCRKPLWVCGLLFAIWGMLLASALFLLVMLAIGVLLALMYYVIRLSRSKKMIQLIAVSLLLALPAIAVFSLSQPDNVRHLFNTIKSGTKIMDYGKVKGTIASARVMLTDTKVLLIGTGPGLYSSRAALVMSGGYLESQPSFIPISRSSYTDEIIYPLWNPSVWSVQYKDGVLNQPFYSMQSLFMEYGAVGIGLIIILYLGFFRRLKTRRCQEYERAILMTAGTFMILLPFIFLTDNWFEYSPVVLQLAPVFALAFNVSRCRSFSGEW